MRFCMPHWQELSEAIKARGLWGLVAQSGQAAVERLKSELEGKATDQTYDPLMAAHWAITNRALEAGGLYLLTGDYCPLCEADKQTPPEPLPAKLSTLWIQGCTDSILAYCREQGLVEWKDPQAKPAGFVPGEDLGPTQAD